MTSNFAAGAATADTKMVYKYMNIKIFRVIILNKTNETVTLG